MEHANIVTTCNRKEKIVISGLGKRYNIPRGLGKKTRSGCVLGNPQTSRVLEFRIHMNTCSNLLIYETRV